MAIKLGWKRFLILFTFFATLCALLWLNIFTFRNVLLALLVTTLLMLISSDGFFEKCYVLRKTFGRDIRTIGLFLTFRMRVFRYLRNRSSVPGEFNKLVRRRPNAVCFMADGRRWTYREVDEFSNRVANVFQQAGLVKGDVVALYMESTPEFVCIWLGLAKLGVTTALINNNLRLQSFTHTVTTAKAKALIFGSNLADAVLEIISSLPTQLTCYSYGDDGDCNKFPFARSLADDMATNSAQSPPPVDLCPDDHLLYIYTSGTTGLPKAAVMTNARYYFISSALNCILKPNDIYYEPLPQYHTSGGIMGTGQALCLGVPVVIKKKFSASQFWTDCIQYNCTVSQYLGELCRYLLAQPPKPTDRSHSIRLMIGSGLRTQIWESFVSRFGIENIVELYGATEGNANIVNIDGKVGAVGFIPTIFSSLLPCALIKVDEKSGVPLRNSKGLCIQCRRGEVGEFVGKIDHTRPDRRFDGYVNQEATAKKIYKDVLQKGDSVFASGDMLVMDRLGYLYFKDRTGDTFRWKGENVSTTEVEAVISNHIELNDCVAYGVQVPNCEGRAGMAAMLDPNHSVDLDKLYNALVRELPSYARPLFIRITDTLPLTGTFKLKKVDLQNDGFDPAKCGHNQLYYLNSSKYEILTQEIYQDICSGKIRY